MSSWRRPLDTDQDPAKHMTAWWAQALDWPLISSRSAPSSEKVWRSIMFAVLFLWPTVVGLVQGQTDYLFIGTLALSVRFALGAWSTYLQINLAHHGLDDVSWYDMPSLTRRAGGPVWRLLAQWRLATIAKLVVSVVLFLLIAARVAGGGVHARSNSDSSRSRYHLAVTELCQSAAPLYELVSAAKTTGKNTIPHIVLGDLPAPSDNLYRRNPQ